MTPCRAKLYLGLVFLFVILLTFHCYYHWSMAAGGGLGLFKPTHARKGLRKKMKREIRHPAFQRLLAGVGGALDRENIKWTIAFGTLLGWHREHDFIAHDDDVDLICFVEDSDAIIRALVEHTTFLITDRAKSNGRIMATDEESQIQLDIFLFERVGDNYRQHTYLGRKIWPGHGNHFFNQRIFFPLQRSHLKGISVLAPNDPETFLEMRYGPNYMIPDK